MIRILVVEDNRVLRTEVEFFLSHHGHQVQGVGDGRALDKALAAQDYDIVVLDLGLPGEDGISIAQRLAARPGANLGIIALTARSGLDERILGLRSGMDAYLVKPADLRELLALVESLYRRIRNATPDAGLTWRLSRSRRCMTTPQGEQVSLSATEVAVIKALAAGAGNSVTRKQIIAAMGQNYLEFDERRLEVAISRLRRKLVPETPANSPLRADRGTGYCFVAPLLLED